MLLCHGTDAISALNIIKFGVKNVDSRLWTESEPNTFYAWSQDFLAQYDCNDEDDTEESYGKMIDRGLESGMVACALSGNETVVALEFEIDENVITEDATKGMLHTGAAQVNAADFNTYATIRCVHIATFPKFFHIFGIPIWENAPVIIPNDIKPYIDIITKATQDICKSELLDQFMSDSKTYSISAFLEMVGEA